MKVASGVWAVRRSLAVAVVGVMCVALGISAAGAPPAYADTAPPAGTPATVSADALPTVQQNGVVWSQAVVRNTVYATGRFSQTWPAGTSNTAANDTPRANLLAFDLTTGVLVTGFNHALNAQGLAAAASPDGSRVYVGGDFTTVDGQPHNHIVAFDTATGAVVTSFRATVSGQVRAISATNSTVYVGGSFTRSGSVIRNSLAAFNAADGSLVANWAPSVEQPVWAMVVTPDQSEVVIGGAFLTLNGSNVYGLGAVTTATGSLVPYAANQAIRDYRPLDASSGTGAAITSLATDGSQIYGSGYALYAGNLEGTFAVQPNTGVINWVDDCHGDTYSVMPVGQVLYSAGHAHDCRWIGAFPEASPRVNHHALAEASYASANYNIGPDSYGFNYRNFHDSALLHWFPTLAIGTVTGQYQAAWSVAGNSTYVSYAGEFPTVNGRAQQGIVRFAIPSVAPDKMGPLYNAGALTPHVSASSSTSAALSWSATWDYDNRALSYRVYRNGAGPVYTTNVNSNFWQLPTMSFLDTGLTPGATYSYVVRVYDANGNSTSGSAAAVTLPGGGGGGGGGATTTANDNFARTVSGGWGVATSGQAWGSASPGLLNVASGHGMLVMSAPGSGPSVYLSTLSTTSTDTTATVSADKVGTGTNGISMGIIGRWISAGVGYRALVQVFGNNSIGIALMSDNAGVQTYLAGETTLPGVTFTANLPLRVRLQVSGANPTALRLKVWPASSTEPTSWQLSATNSTASLQAAGTVGFRTYLSGSAINAPVQMTVAQFATAPVQP